MSFKILVVGCGNLGLRYLEGLAKLEEKMVLTICDEKNTAFNQAEKILKNLKYPYCDSIEFKTSLSDIRGNFDLALVITPANCRVAVVEEIYNSCDVNAWVLEKVLAQSVEQLDSLDRNLSINKKVWVNTSRRLMPWHKNISTQLAINNNYPLKVIVSGGSWGLACNAIHFIDLVTWWSKSSVQHVNCQGLRSWSKSKRAGFHEAFGSIMVRFDDGSELELGCDSSDETTRIAISNPTGEWLIEESSGMFTDPYGKKLRGRINYQSELTAPLVQEILNEGTCGLPSLTESLTQHRPLLSSLLSHWNQHHGIQDSVVPIT